MTRRRVRWLPLSVLAAVAAGAVAYLLSGSGGQVDLVGGEAGPQGPVYHPGQPLQAHIDLGGPLGQAQVVLVAIYALDEDAERPFKTLTQSARANYDELAFRAQDVAALVEARRGRFRLAWLRDAELLGAAEFVVAGP